MICPFCNQEHPDNYQFCPITGKKFSMLKACPSPMCPDYGKHILPMDSLFCPTCGCKLEIEGKLVNGDCSKISLSVGSVSFNMIKVEGGTFKMGSTNGEGRERPVHDVTVSSFYIGETQVTQALWTEVMGENPSDFIGDDKPANRVNWFDCELFIKKLNEITNHEFRFPTEAEWEFSARGGKKSKGYEYAGSNKIEEVAWFDDNSNGEVHQVSKKKPNELGIYDMSGNVWEWCQDWGERGYYKKSPNKDPQGPSSGTSRVVRGGGRNSIAGNCRIAYRNFNSSNNKRSSIGLRLVLVLNP